MCVLAPAVAAVGGSAYTVGVEGIPLCVVVGVAEDVWCGVSLLVLLAPVAVVVGGGDVVWEWVVAYCGVVSGGVPC